MRLHKNTSIINECRIFRVFVGRVLAAVKKSALERKRFVFIATESIVRTA